MSSDCSWFITAPTDTFIVVKMRNLEMPVFGDVVLIGEGFDIYNRTAVRWIIRGDTIVRPMLVRANKAWVRLQSDGETSADNGEHFSMEFHAVSPIG